MVGIQKRVRRLTLQCLLMMFIVGVLGAPVVEAATVVLAWDPSPDPQIIGYNVYRSESLGSYAVSALNGGTLVSEPTFTDYTGEWNRTYYYVVTAVNYWGQESAPSATVQAASWLPVFAGQSEAVGAQENVAQPQPPQPVETTPAPPPSNPVIALATFVGAAVTTSVTDEGLRWFDVNGVSYPWGYYSDVPVSGDFDGDGQTDISVYRPSDGFWWVLTSTSGFSSYIAIPFGMDTDTPVPNDYDSDGKTDIAVFRPSTGVWFILTSSSDFTSWFSY